MSKVWNDTTKQFIRDNFETMKDRELTEAISKMSGKEVKEGENEQALPQETHEKRGYPRRSFSHT